METAVVIMNGNLRMHDNPALHAAATSGCAVIPIYLLDLQSKELGTNHKWWLKESIGCLSKRMPLIVRKGDPVAAIKSVLKESKAVSLYWNESYDPGERKFYKSIENSAVQMGVEILVGEANLLVDPEELKSQSGGYFKVYSPFWRRCLSVLEPTSPLPVPKARWGKKLRSDTVTAPAHETLGEYWKAGEEAARAKFSAFCRSGLADYSTERDRPDHDGTSMLSPHLRWGEISVREIWHALKKSRSAGTKTFLGEIGFREFSYYMLYHFPGLGKMNFRSEFNEFSWSSGTQALEAWKVGETGYPIVDAGMRQLLEMGWMHNRVRMIVASFLTKDLLIDWRKGERWFWDQLVDGDPALNAFNWQWVSGSGVDAAPYFRIFNPVLQGKKFDPDGAYVTDWVDELHGLEKKHIHQPWMCDEELDYPGPIVDHDEMRKEALARYKKLPKSA